MAPSSVMHRFEYEGWNVVVELDDAAFDGSASGHADLYWKHGHKCRIALTGQFKDDASAIASLLEKARAFVDDWYTERGHKLTESV